MFDGRFSFPVLTQSSLPREGDVPGAPEPPQAPTSPQTQRESSVATLEREETSESDGDQDRFAHYVKKDSITRSRASGRPVVALCGKIWRPKHDPSKYPVCPECKEIYNKMTGK